MKYFIQSWFLDLPGQPKKRTPVKEGQNPESAASSLRGFYSSSKGAKYGRVVVTVIEVYPVTLDRETTQPKIASGWVVFDATLGHLVAQGLTEEESVELLELNEGKDYTRWQVN